MTGRWFAALGTAAESDHVRWTASLSRQRMLGGALLRCFSLILYSLVRCAMKGKRACFMMPGGGLRRHCMCLLGWIGRLRRLSRCGLQRSNLLRQNSGIAFIARPIGHGNAGRMHFMTRFTLRLWCPIRGALHMRRIMRLRQMWLALRLSMVRRKLRPLTRIILYFG